MSPVAFLVVLAAFSVFAARRLLRYLHFFQQDDYNARRFLGWIFRAGAFDRKLSLALLALVLLGYFLLPAGLRAYAAALILVVFAALEPDPRKGSKKNLAMTSRARRIFGVALALNLAAAIFAVREFHAFGCIITVQLIPFLLVAGNELLAPFEARVQKKYWDEAAARLAQINPTVIGITGSFGKTSVKHILGHILEMQARTTFTPGSVNTPMGIARVIREKLPADCKYFLVEMGAYGPGSIERLCRLAPPDFGIITALGEAHYERYKSLGAVARAKFELAQAVLKKPLGKIVVPESVQAQDYARAFVRDHADRFIICGQGPDAQLKIEKIEQTRAGLNVQIGWQGESIQLSAPLFGAHHADNIAVAFAAAMSLGLASERVASALRTVPQIKHRLEVKPQAGGSIIVDDAFNSNPRGFASALELLTLIADGGRRILITPGVAELGERNNEVHGRLGALAAKHVDAALVVRADRIPAFAPAYVNAGGRQLVEVASLAEAQAWLRQNALPKDVVLYENDLPDVLERKLSL